jgi:hypothetical protein
MGGKWGGNGDTQTRKFKGEWEGNGGGIDQGKCRGNGDTQTRKFKGEFCRADFLEFASKMPLD